MQIAVGIFTSPLLPILLLNLRFLQGVITVADNGYCGKRDLKLFHFIRAECYVRSPQVFLKVREFGCAWYVNNKWLFYS